MGSVDLTPGCLEWFCRQIVTHIEKLNAALRKYYEQKLYADNKCNSRELVKCAANGNQIGLPCFFTIFGMKTMKKNLGIPPFLKQARAYNNSFAQGGVCVSVANFSFQMPAQRKAASR